MNPRHGQGQWKWYTMVEVNGAYKYNRGRTYAKKLCFFYAKKEQATQIWKCRAFTVPKKQWPHTSKCVESFRFLHLAEKVCRALAVGLNILDFPRPLPPPFPIASQWMDAGAYVTMFMTPIDTDTHAHHACCRLKCNWTKFVRRLCSHACLF